MSLLIRARFPFNSCWPALALLLLISLPAAFQPNTAFAAQQESTDTPAAAEPAQVDAPTEQSITQIVNEAIEPVDAWFGKYLVGPLASFFFFDFALARARFLASLHCLPPGFYPFFKIRLRVESRTSPPHSGWELAPHPQCVGKNYIGTRGQPEVNNPRNGYSRVL